MGFLSSHCSELHLFWENSCGFRYEKVSAVTSSLVDDLWCRAVSIIELPLLPQCLRASQPISHKAFSPRGIYDSCKIPVERYKLRNYRGHYFDEYFSMMNPFLDHSFKSATQKSYPKVLLFKDEQEPCSKWDSWWGKMTFQKRGKGHNFSIQDLWNLLYWCYMVIRVTAFRCDARCDDLTTTVLQYINSEL